MTLQIQSAKFLFSPDKKAFDKNLEKKECLGEPRPHVALVSLSERKCFMSQEPYLTKKKKKINVLAPHPSTSPGKSQV